MYHGCFISGKIVKSCAKGLFAAHTWYCVGTSEGVGAFVWVIYICVFYTLIYYVDYLIHYICTCARLFRVLDSERKASPSQWINRFCLIALSRDLMSTRFYGRLCLLNFKFTTNQIQFFSISNPAIQFSLKNKNQF